MIPRRALIAAALPLLTAGCASAEPDYYRLEVTPGAVLRGAPARVELRQPGLARYLDRGEIVRAGGPVRISLLPDARWAEPLGEMLARVLAEALTQRLPGSTVLREGSAITLESDATAELDILRFEDDGQGRVVLLAQIATQRSPQGRRDTRNLRLEAPLQGADTAAMVTAMSVALGQLADALAQMLAERGAA